MIRMSPNINPLLLVQFSCVYFDNYKRRGKSVKNCRARPNAIYYEIKIMKYCCVYKCTGVR